MDDDPRAKATDALNRVASKNGSRRSGLWSRPPETCALSDPRVTLRRVDHESWSGSTS
jgi:hypothetical protein